MHIIIEFLLWLRTEFFALLIRWQESLGRFRHIFDLNMLQQSANVKVYYLDGNHDIGYAAFNSRMPEVSYSAIPRKRIFLSQKLNNLFAYHSNVKMFCYLIDHNWVCFCNPKTSYVWAYISKSILPISNNSYFIKKNSTINTVDAFSNTSCCPLCPLGIPNLCRLPDAMKKNSVQGTIGLHLEKWISLPLMHKHWMVRETVCL